MTDDELCLNIESLRARVHEFLESVQRRYAQIENDAENIRARTGIARDTLASIQSLERTATAHQGRVDEHGKRIEDLEE